MYTKLSMPRQGLPLFFSHHFVPAKQLLLEVLWVWALGPVFICCFEGGWHVLKLVLTSSVTNLLGSVDMWGPQRSCILASNLIS